MTNQPPERIRVGTVATPALLAGGHEVAAPLLARAAETGLDHVFVADHVSFFVGTGMDGLMQAALIAGLEPSLEIVVGIYLLALRHPVPVARQISTLCQAAPGRLVLGVGVGGEDRHEIEVCGVDPSTRGARTDSCLEVLRELLAGKPTTHAGPFFEFEDALILPAPVPEVPILVGGRSEAAIHRAGRHSEGWLATWVSPTRYGTATQQVEAMAVEAGRDVERWEHGLQIWVGVDADRARARARLARGMENMYRIPFESFERYSPYGSPAEIADFLAPYAEAGCTRFNIMPVASSPQYEVEAVAEIRERLLNGAQYPNTQRET